MATIQNTIKMKDSVGSVLKSIITSVDMTISAMEKLGSSSDRIDLSGDFASVKQQIGLTRNELNMFDDEIRKAKEEQENFNNKIRDGTNSASSLKAMFASIGGAMALKKLINTSDQWIQTAARLDIINDGLQTTEELQRKIFASAQASRGLYTDIATSVSKLGLLAGNAFSNNDEIVKFVEIFQKMGTVSGSSTSEISNAMYQLNQAMASGRLQGDEYRSIIENAPMLAKAIADYMGVGRDELKQMASDGMITADVIKGAMFSVSDAVDEKFKSMPMTWSQVWNGIVNNILVYSQPLLECINFLANNWAILEPIVLGVVIILGAYLSILLLINIANSIVSISEAIKAAKTTLATGATLAQTAAQHGLNAALMACLLTWIIILVIGLIAVFYAAIATVNKFAGTTISA
ncbi:MAG TPA: phage tail tape measure protein, partial [Clostridiales bacterium]|nr:phage tail tape measure protein [Clostridiales bacterium]